MLYAFHRQKSMHIGCISLLEVPIPLLEHVSRQRLLTWFIDFSFIMNHSCAVFMPYLTCYLTSLFVKLYMASFVSLEFIYFFDLCFSFSSSVILLCNCWSRSAVNMESFFTNAVLMLSVLLQSKVISRPSFIIFPRRVNIWRKLQQGSFFFFGVSLKGKKTVNIQCNRTDVLRYAMVSWDVIYPHQLCVFLKISALSIDIGNTRMRFLWSVASSSRIRVVTIHWSLMQGKNKKRKILNQTYLVLGNCETEQEGHFFGWIGNCETGENWCTLTRFWLFL